MSADDTESDEGRPSRSLGRDRGKRRRRRHSARPFPPKQRRKRSRPPGAEEKHTHRTSAAKHEDSTEGHELRNRNAEGVLKEASGREAFRRSGVDDDEKAGAIKSSEGDRKGEVHSSGDSSEDAYLGSDCGRGRKKSRSENQRSRKSKGKHRRHVRAESEPDESQSEGTFGESSGDSEGKAWRAETRKPLKRKVKAEREREDEQMRKKEKLKEKERNQEKRMQKKEKVEEASNHMETQSCGSDSSDDAHSNSDSACGKRKSRSGNHEGRKFNRKHRPHVFGESEQEELQTEGTLGESFEDSEGEYTRVEIRKQLKRKRKAERERKEEHRRKKAKKRRLKEKDREQEKRMKKKEKVEDPTQSTRTQSRGIYGIITELDMRTRRPDFSAWLAEVKKVNVETLTNREEKDMFRQYMEDYNKATFPSEKYYNLDMYRGRKVTEQRSKGMEDMVKKQSERAQLEDEERRWQELIAKGAQMEETGMGKAVRDQAVLREDMQCQYLLGTTEACNEGKDDDVVDRLEGDNMHGERSNGDPALDPKHKIFLSYSGAQKEFVDYLCKALEDRGHYPFFERRDESLPKGARSAELIVEAAEQCEMLIVVVSNEYFLSKWPMIELSAFVKAHKLQHGSKIGAKILPLFYGLSVSDLDNAELQKKWFDKWKTFADADPMKRIVFSDWKDAFHTLRAFNGLLYDMNSKEVVAYVDEIVSQVCYSIEADIKWDDSHVQGKSNILKVIYEWIRGLGPSLRYGVKVLGIYGVGGIGKTTTCKLLCNELSSKDKWRVCHIEFPSVPLFESKELYQKVVRDLTMKSMEVIQSLDKEQCRDVLQKSLFKQRTFLAIDNISDSYQSILEARILLEVGYHKDSVVFVTARSGSVLQRLGIDEDACFEMPDLGRIDAMNLFLHHAIGGKQFIGVEENLDILTCIKRCYFSKGNGQGHHYHPLALQVLGLQLGLYGKSPCEWVKKLSDVNFSKHYSSTNHAFDILRRSFDMLSREEQTLFLDVGFFSILIPSLRCSTIEWLCAAHKEEEASLLLRLERLKQAGLVQDVDTDGKISMHNLYLEFAKLEVSGSFYKSPNFLRPIWKYVANGDFVDLQNNRWHKLIRLCIGEFLEDNITNRVPYGIEGMEGVKWNCFSHLEVLMLFSVDFGPRSLNLEGVIQLRILQLCNLYEIDGVEGLRKLKHLNIFSWTSPNSNLVGLGGHIVGQLPSSLKQLTITGRQVVVESNLLAQCNNLFHLKLSKVVVHSLDLRNCSSLESVSLHWIEKLQTLMIGNACSPSCLKHLVIDRSHNLVHISRIDHLTNLKKLEIEECSKWKVPSLLALTNLQILTLTDQQFLAGSMKDCFPCQLQQLCLWRSEIGERLNLVGFNALEVLDLTSAKGLMSLEDLGDLPALRDLNLKNCMNLLRLPNLSSSRSLQKLNLTKCVALKLHEEDIQMLCDLPKLQPVYFTMGLNLMITRLDFPCRKVLFQLSKHSPLDAWGHCKADERHEQDFMHLH